MQFFVELFTAHLFEKRSRFYHFRRLRYMRNKNVVNIFGGFLTFGKMLSFYIVTSSDRLSRVFINFVVNKKNFMLSSSKQKRNIRLSLFSNGVIYENFSRGLLEHPVYIRT